MGSLSSSLAMASLRNSPPFPDEYHHLLTRAQPPLHQCSLFAFVTFSSASPWSTRSSLFLLVLCLPCVAWKTPPLVPPSQDQMPTCHPQVRPMLLITVAGKGVSRLVGSCSCKLCSASFVSQLCPTSLHLPVSSPWFLRPSSTRRAWFCRQTSPPSPSVCVIWVRLAPPSAPGDPGLANLSRCRGTAMGWE